MKRTTQVIRHQANYGVVPKETVVTVTSNGFLYFIFFDGDKIVTQRAFTEGDVRSLYEVLKMVLE